MVLNWEVRLFRFLNRFLFSKQKPCLLLVPLECAWPVYLYCIYKPSVNSSNQSIFRSIIDLDIKLCKKNNKNNKFFLRIHSTQLLGKKYHAMAVTLGVICDHGRDSMIAIPWNPR